MEFDLLAFNNVTLELKFLPFTLIYVLFLISFAETSVFICRYCNEKNVLDKYN